MRINSLIMFFRRSPKGRLLRDNALIILISFFWVALDTWLFKQSVFLKSFEIGIRLVIPVILVLFFRKYTLPNKAKILLFLYGILSFYMLFISIFSENPQLVVVNTLKLLHALTFFVALLLIFHPNNFSYRLLYIPVCLGLLFSIQTIILFVFVQSGVHLPNYIETLEGYGDKEVLSYGLFGYAHGMNAMGSDLQVYRSTSFFGEPTDFARFMEIAVILSFGLYKIKKSKIMLLISILCAISLILAFSMTAYVVVFVTYCFYKIVLNWKKMGILRPVFGVVSMFMVVSIILLYFYGATHPEFYAQSRVGFAFGHGKNEIFIRLEALKNALDIFMNHPFGVGLIAHADSKILLDYPTIGAWYAPLGWIIHAGIVGIVTQATILLYLLKKIIIKFIKMSSRIERYVALSFVANILHQNLAGNWFTASFFYLVACLIAMEAYRFSFTNQTNQSFSKTIKKTT